MKTVLVIAFMMSGSCLTLALPPWSQTEYKLARYLPGYRNNNPNRYDDYDYQEESFDASTNANNDDYSDFLTYNDADDEDIPQETSVQDMNHSQENEAESDVIAHNNADRRVIFSAHIGDFFKFNILSSEGDENLKAEDTNPDDITATTTASSDLDDTTNEHNVIMENVANNEMSVLLKRSSVSSPQNVELLSKLSLSSSNSKLLANEFQDNVRDFKETHKNLEDALNTLNYQSKMVSDKFILTAAGRTDYNGQQHKDIQVQLTQMLSNIDKVREKIAGIQSIEQKLNYHMLLNALLTEVYGQGEVL